MKNIQKPKKHLIFERGYMKIVDTVWSQKYRPKTIADTILTNDLKKTFQSFVDKKDVPNLLLHGRAGVGKTTVAMAMLEEIGADYIMVNGSLDGNIDTLRTTITQFASTTSFMGGRKYVIIDESDALTALTQASLRNFMEQFSKNCGFILTANFINKIIEPLHSRCSLVDFNIPTKEKPKLAMEFFERAQEILTMENVEYEKKALAEFINKYFPDWRRIINELQRYAGTGKIDKGILVNYTDSSLDEMFKYIKDKNFTKLRNWISENNSLDSATLYTNIFKMLPDKILGAAGIANAILIIAKYQFQEGQVANPEINRTACMIELMADIGDWK